MEEKTMLDIFETWDRGEFFFSKVEKQLMDLPDGQVLGDILKTCTKCPIHNGTCESMMVIILYGVHPKKGHQRVEIQICPLGIPGDGEKCPLNK